MTPIITAGGEELNNDLYLEARRNPRILKVKQLRNGTRHPNMAIACLANQKKTVFSCLKLADELGTVEAILHEYEPDAMRDGLNYGTQRISEPRFCVWLRMENPNYKHLVSEPWTVLRAKRGTGKAPLETWKTEDHLKEWLKILEID